MKTNLDKIDDLRFNLPNLFNLSIIPWCTPLLTIPTHMLCCHEDTQIIQKIIYKLLTENLPNKIDGTPMDRDILFSEIYIYLTKHRDTDSHCRFVAVLEEEIGKHPNVTNSEKMMNGVKQIFEEIIHEINTKKTRIEAAEKEEQERKKQSERAGVSLGIKDSDDALVVFQSPDSPDQKIKNDNSGASGEAKDQKSKKNVKNEVKISYIDQLRKECKTGKVFKELPTIMPQSLYDLFKISSTRQPSSDRLDFYGRREIPLEQQHNHKAKLYKNLELDKDDKMDNNNNNDDKLSASKIRENRDHREHRNRDHHRDYKKMSYDERKRDRRENEDKKIAGMTSGIVLPEKRGGGDDRKRSRSPHLREPSPHHTSYKNKKRF